MPLKMIIDAVVYGIRVDGLEGSVGMAALVKNREAGSDEVNLRVEWEFRRSKVKLITLQLD